MVQASNPDTFGTTPLLGVLGRSIWVKALELESIAGQKESCNNCHPTSDEPKKTDGWINGLICDPDKIVSRQCKQHKSNQTFFKSDLSPLTYRSDILKCDLRLNRDAACFRIQGNFYITVD